MKKEEKKYTMTDDTIVVDGHKLSRIKALRDFGNVKKGELGGYISSEKNLSHYGTCWVSDNAQVRDNAFVGGSAQVRDSAIVCDFAIVRDSATVSEFAIVGGYAIVDDDSRVSGESIFGIVEFFKKEQNGTRRKKSK